MTKEIGFIGIGTHKAATSWIYQCLKEHPEICTSNLKETMFWKKKRSEKNSTEEYFRLYYKECPKKTIKGEFTPGYMYSDEAIKQIAKYYPKTKLIICLRNPIEKLNSWFFFLKSKNPLLEKQTIDIFLQNNTTLLQQGLYYQYLKKWFSKFPKENIKIILYEKLEKNPLKIIQDLYFFLEVNQNFYPNSLNLKVNATTKKKFRSRILQNKLKKSYIKLKSHKLGKHICNFLKLLKFNYILMYIFKINEINSTLNKKTHIKKDLPLKTIKYLQNYYKNDIKNLEALINEDLSNWE